MIYMLYDNYELEFGELLYQGSDFKQLMKVARERFKDTDGECNLQYIETGCRCEQTESLN